jgi:hypothetical protein
MTVLRVVMIAMSVHAVFLLVIQVRVIQVLVILVLLLRAVVVMTVLRVVMIAMSVHAVPVLHAQVVMTVLLVAMTVAQFREAMIAVMSGVAQMVSAATIATLRVAQATIGATTVANMSKLIVVMRVMRFAIHAFLTTSHQMTSIRACRKSCVRFLKDCRFLSLGTLSRQSVRWPKKISIWQLSM